MKNTALMLALTIPFGAYASEENSIPTPESITSAQVLKTQGEQRPIPMFDVGIEPTHHMILQPQIGNGRKKENGDYYTINGYWWSSVSFKNMFYSDAPQSEIKQRCEQTLGLQHDARRHHLFCRRQSLLLQSLNLDQR